MKKILSFITIFSFSYTKGYSQTWENPIIRHIFTADPAALVYRDTFYIFTGHDEQAPGVNWFFMRDWHVFSSVNFSEWTDHGPCLSLNTFSWAVSDAWAGQCIERNGKFYWYVPVRTSIRKAKPEGGFTEGFAIGIAVADHPAGPYSDALGRPFLSDTVENTLDLNIDPTVFIDDNEQAYLIWGGWGKCRMVRLKENMTEYEGSVMDVPGLTNFLEAPYLHKKDSLYYLSYAAGWPETTQYAMSNSPEGPWMYKGLLNATVSSETNHHSIVQYHDKWYFVYHNGSLPEGGNYRRSVCLDTLGYRNDGTMKQILQTTGFSPIKSGYTKTGISVSNPVKNGTFHIEINYPVESVLNFHLYDLSGRILIRKTFDLPGNEILFITKDLRPGIYIYYLFTGNTLQSDKIIVL